MHTHQIKIRCRGVIVHEGKMLLVRHMHTEGEADFFALPGGHLEYGETPEECMKRELEEELGVVPDVGRLLFVHSLVQGEEKQSIEFFFEIKNGADFINHEEMEKTHAFEIAECTWKDIGSDVYILPKAFGMYFKEGDVFPANPVFISGVVGD